MSASLGISQSVMVIVQLITARRGHGVKSMIWKRVPIYVSGRGQGIQEHVVRIVHLINLKDRFEASFVKPAIVSHQRKPLNERCNLLPDIGEYWSILRILRPESVHLTAEPLVILRFWVDQAIEGIHDSPIPNYNYSHAAYTAWALVCCLKVYRRKICHNP